MESRTEQTIEQLREWVASVVPGVAVELLSATDPGTGGRIEIRMVRITPQPLPNDGRGTRKVWLDYLVSAPLADPSREQQVLADLVFSALEQPGFELLAEVAPLQGALGLRAVPALVLRLPLVREGRARQVPLVRFPLEVTAGDMQAFEGRGVAAGAEAGPGSPAAIQQPVEN